MPPAGFVYAEAVWLTTELRVFGRSGKEGAVKSAEVESKVGSDVGAGIVLGLIVAVDAVEVLES